MTDERELPLLRTEGRGPAMSSRDPESELPPPSTELVLIGVIMRSYVRNLPPKERLRVLSEITTKLDEMVLGSNVHWIRSRKEAAAAKGFSIKARVWWRLALSTFLSNLQ